MIKHLACLAALSVAFTGCSDAVQNTRTLDMRLRTDGIYQSLSAEDAGNDKVTRHFLRFYEDSVVVSASSTGEIERVKTWLKKGRKNDVSGVVRMDGDSIAFTTSSPEGEVDYNGSIVEDTLKLTPTSRIPGYERVGNAQTYTFCPTTPD